MSGDGSAAITAGSLSVGLAYFATQSFKQFPKHSLEVNLHTKMITLLSVASYLQELELDIVEVDRQYHRTVEKRLEHQEQLLVAKRASFSENVIETFQKIRWLECKVQ